MEETNEQVDNAKKPWYRDIKIIPPLAVLGVIAVVALLIALNSDDQPEPSLDAVGSSSTTTSTTEASDQTYKVGDRVKTPFGNTIQVHALQDPANVGYDPDAGERYVAVDAEYCRHSEVESSIPAEIFYVKLADNSRVKGEYAKEPALEESTLADGECTRGFASFGVVVNAKIKEIIFEAANRSGDAYTIRWIP